MAASAAILYTSNLLQEEEGVNALVCFVRRESVRVCMRVCVRYVWPCIHAAIGTGIAWLCVLEERRRIIH